MARKRTKPNTKASRRAADYGGYPNALVSKQIPAFPKALKIRKKGG